jgi:hypothetical protein
METGYYHWLDYFTKTMHSTKCEVLERGEKTTRIRLLECSKNGALPGTEMRVSNKSVTIPFDNSGDSWKGCCYFD